MGGGVDENWLVLCNLYTSKAVLASIEWVRFFTWFSRSEFSIFPHEVTNGNGKHWLTRNTLLVPDVSAAEQAYPTIQCLCYEVSLVTNCRLLRIVTCYELSYVTNSRPTFFPTATRIFKLSWVMTLTGCM